jgi:histidine triad (HIT) family protein
MIASCKFCKIINKELSSAIVYEDENLFAFLDSRPVFQGHTLLIPKKHVDNFDKMPKKLIRDIFVKAQQISLAVEKAMHASGTFLCMNNKVSQSVPHCHLHIIPRKTKDGLRGFLWPRLSYDKKQLLLTKNKIKKALSELGTD